MCAGCYEDFLLASARRSSSPRSSDTARNRPLGSCASDPPQSACSRPRDAALCGEREGQMPDVREVYEMVTKQKAPEPGALERQQRRQVRTARNKKLGALVVAAAVGLLAVVVLFAATRGGPGTSAPNQAATKPTPVEIATGFLRAFGAFDVRQAETYLAADAVISSMGADDDLRLLIGFLEGTGYEQTVGRC